jgi:drug/metabolite transporter (DMT)-like permease
LRVFLLTAAALVGFSANSLLTRAALGGGQLDAATFMAVRLVTGAVTLVVLARLRRTAGTSDRGSWTLASSLAFYAIFFTLAYKRIGAGVGALVLFGSVQVTMIGTGLARGERPSVTDWIGLTLAAAGLLTFTLPGASAPDPLGVVLMALAGACWGAYSLGGRGRRDPLGATAGNFVRATLFGVAFAALSTDARHLTATGLLLATASGALASGVGYTLWYAALPSLTAWRAAIVQLIVPVLTAIAAAVLLHETVTLRLAGATALILTGVWLSARPRARTSPETGRATAITMKME